MYTYECRYYYINNCSCWRVDVTWLWLSFATLHSVKTHWGRDKMAAISQATLSNAFSWMKMLDFRLKFHRILFIRIQLTLNVLGDCGSSRPLRVEPRLHCVGIAWQVWERCVGNAAHSPLHAIAARALSAARAIEQRPTYFTRVRALGDPRTHSAAHVLCVGPRTLQPAHSAALALISVSMQFLTH